MGRVVRRSDAPTLEGCLAQARAGRPEALYLFDGDPFLSWRAARELAGVLVPESQRSLNLVELDAAATPSEIAAELATSGLFGGSKVVLVQEPAFLQSKEDLAESFERSRTMWAEGRQREAARRLLVIAAKAGWTAEDLLSAEGDAPSAARWKKELSIDLDAAGESFLSEVARYACERGMKAARDDSGALDALLSRGLAAGQVLIVAAGKIDGRLPLVKRICACGPRVTVAVETEGQWGDQRPVLGPVLRELLDGTGKTLDSGAERRIAERVGSDARALATEVAKLVAFVGERQVIRAADVDQTVAQVAADPFFALGNAVEARDLPSALGVLGRSLDSGASPHMLLGSLAATVRRLIVERERGRVAAGDRPIESFPEWTARVLPKISPDELGTRKPYGFWMKYQASRRFTRSELLSALVELAEADHAMKTGGDGPLLLERALLHLLNESKRSTT
jgi:DNA polymerase III subunit delta